MDMKITPARLSGTLDAISSKSLVHRLLICSALAGKETRIRLNGTCDDILSTIRCIEAMGGSIKNTDRQEMLVTPLQKASGKSVPSSVVLHCGESGATARFMMPLAAHLFDQFKLVGEGKLPMRPFAPLCEALESAGCTLDGDRPPISGSGRVTSGDFKIAGNISSQFISGLLFLLPLLSEDSRVSIMTPLESEGYVNMTIEVISMFGIAIEDCEPCPGGIRGFRVSGNRRFDSPGIATTEGDWSNSAFFLCMGALGDVAAGITASSTAAGSAGNGTASAAGDGGDTISLRGLSTSSEQGDKEVVEVLKRFGANVRADTNSNIKAGAGTLRGTDIDAAQIPDLIPALAVVAAVSEGETRIFNAQRLRLKESDRIHSTYNMLSSLGADVKTTDDGLIIYGKEKLSGGVVDGARDHRIVMAAATASCVCENTVVIKGYEAVNKSYTSFFGDFRSLGGIADVI
ncbi:MAG: 3-phosphoshikimate 1-carboxyvinyltransferase [Treponema sp.]|nr:3-phosphoshikimate 1-carboxyvinyltransferase [Treponema sp.]